MNTAERAGAPTRVRICPLQTAPGPNKNDRARSHTLRAYLATTGVLFALLALAHLLRTIAESSRLATDPWFILEGPGIGIAAGAICVWAWRLLRLQATSR